MLLTVIFALPRNDLLSIEICEGERTETMCVFFAHFCVFFLFSFVWLSNGPHAELGGGINDEV